MTGSSPMSAAKGQPAAIVPATTQTPKAIIPTEIKNESTLSMIGPPFFRAQTIDGAESFDSRLADPNPHRTVSCARSSSRQDRRSARNETYKFRVPVCRFKTRHCDGTGDDGCELPEIYGPALGMNRFKSVGQT